MTQSEASSAPVWFASREVHFLESTSSSGQSGEYGSRTWPKGRRRSIFGGQFSLVDVGIFLDKIYRLSGSDEQGAIDAVYDFMDDCLLDADFSICDQTLASANPEKLLPSVILSFLIVTQRAKKELRRGRLAFFQKAMIAVSGTHGSVYAEKLLGKNR